MSFYFDEFSLDGLCTDDLSFSLFNECLYNFFIGVGVLFGFDIGISSTDNLSFYVSTDNLSLDVIIECLFFRGSGDLFG